MNEVFRVRLHTKHAFDFVNAPISRVNTVEELTDDEKYMLTLTGITSGEIYRLEDNYDAFSRGSLLVTDNNGVDVLVENISVDASTGTGESEEVLL